MVPLMNFIRLFTFSTKLFHAVLEMASVADSSHLR